MCNEKLGKTALCPQSAPGAGNVGGALWLDGGGNSAQAQTLTIPGYPVTSNRGTFYIKGQIQQKNTHCPYKTVLMKRVGCLPVHKQFQNE